MTESSLNQREMKNYDPIDNAVLKDIKKGKYRDRYLIYSRKSTDEADNQKNSIKVQRRENRRFAKKSQLPIAELSLKNFCAGGVISERHSAFKETNDVSFSKDGKVQYKIGRPKFLQMVQFLNAGYFKGIICLSADRLSRNKADNAIISKLRRRGVDFRFTIATYDRSSAGVLHFNIDELFNNYHSLATSDKVERTTRENRLDGICTYRAPIGYLNQGSMTDKLIDPVRGPIIAKMFELYATGKWSLSDLARYANEQGMTTVPMRRRRTQEELLAEDEIVLEKTARPITENHVSRILRNRFYTGRTLGPDGGYVSSVSHKALVDDDTFECVQQLLIKKTVSVHYDKLLDHPLRGCVRCTFCKRVYTPYTKKGILYFNARCLRGCDNNLKNCNLDHITNEVRKRIANLYFTEDELSRMEAQLSTDIFLLEQKRHADIEQQERSKKRIREELAYLRSDRLNLLRTGAYAADELVADQSKLEKQYDDILDREITSEQAMRETMKDITTLSELINNVAGVYDFASPHKKEEIIKILFSELFLSQNGLEYKLQNGLQAFEDRLSAVGDPTAWLSELYRERRYIRANIDALQNLSALA